jgi:aminoglycoside phosphotransferase (APT) family kinase protein
VTPTSALITAANDHPELWQVAGWQILLPPLADRHVLCVDSQGWLSAVLAARCRALTVLCPASQGAEVMRRLAALGMGHVAVRGVEPAAPDESPTHTLQRFMRALPCPYDGIVVAHTAVLAAPPAAGATPRHMAGLLAQLARAALADDGFMYVECGNRWAVRSSGNQPGPGEAGLISRPALSARAVRRALRDAGMADVRMHPYLLSHARLEEVLPSHGYVATKNRELRRERIKELLFGRRGARLFAHAYGLVASRRGLRSVQDVIVQHLGVQYPGVQDPGTQRAGGAPQPLRVTKVLVFHSMKLILVLEAPGHDGAGLVVVVSSDEVVSQRRTQEARVLAALGLLPPDLARMVPRLVDQFNIDGNDCFVLTKLPGLTLEADVPQLPAVTASAVDFLVALSQHAATPVPVDQPLLDTVFGPLFDAAARTQPPLQAQVERLRHSVEPRLLGRLLPLGWCHGDFKIENVTYDAATLRVAGVLDWEHATQTGLPYIDLMYLLLYNRGIRGAGWVDAFRGLALQRRLSAEETRLEQRFLAGTGTPADLLPVLAAMFLVHHVGVRLALMQWTPEQLVPIRELLEHCHAAVDALPLPMAGGRGTGALHAVRSAERAPLN